jgi:hypothetical protein
MNDANIYLIWVVFYLMTLIVALIIISKKMLDIKNEAIANRDRYIADILKTIHKHDDYHRSG